MPRPVVVRHEIDERPQGYVAPDLSPQGLKLKPKRLGEGVFGLMANSAPKDNNGVVIGSRAALVIDSGVAPEIGRHIQDVVGQLTDRPIAYLANTTFHGDHTFGNTAFAESVTVVSSRANKAAMDDLNREKVLRSESMKVDPDTLADVLVWRRPELSFDEYIELDLGNKVVELWHFGPGNGSGDTIVYVPDAKACWTGNFLGRAGIAPMMLIGDPVSYIASLEKMRSTLDVEQVVPGHGFVAEARPAMNWMISYLDRLLNTVSTRKKSGDPLEQMLNDIPIWDQFKLPALLPPAKKLNKLNTDMHRLNILATYRWLDTTAA